MDGGAGVRLGDDVAVIDSSRSPEWHLRARCVPLGRGRSRAQRGQALRAAHAGHGRAHDVGGVGRRGGARDGGRGDAAAASDTVASLRGPGPRGSSDMADEDTFPLDGDGLREVVWDECDAPFVGPFVASPADAEGRGIALSVDARRGGGGPDGRLALPPVAPPRAARARLRAPRGGRRRGGQVPRVLAGGDGARRGHRRRAGHGLLGRAGALVALLHGAGGAGADGGEGGGSDGYSLFLDAPQEVRGRGRASSPTPWPRRRRPSRRPRGAVATAGQAVEAAQGALRRGRRRQRGRRCRDAGEGTICSPPPSAATSTGRTACREADGADGAPGAERAGRRRRREPHGQGRADRGGPLW